MSHNNAHIPQSRLYHCSPQIYARGSWQTGTSEVRAALTAFRDLQGEIQRLERRVDRLQESNCIVWDSKLSPAELVEPIELLEDTLSELRLQSDMRFSAVERRQNALPPHLVTLAEDINAETDLIFRELSAIRAERQYYYTHPRLDGSGARPDASRSSTRTQRGDRTSEGLESCLSLQPQALPRRHTTFELPTHPLPRKGEARLHDPRYYFTFVDVLLNLVTSKNEVEVEELSHAMQVRWGQVYHEMMSATRGKIRFFALAECFIKIRWIRHNIISLDDPQHPFWEEQNNEAYFRRARYFEAYC